MIIMYYKWNLDFKTHYNVLLYLHLTRLLYFSPNSFRKSILKYTLRTWEGDNILLMNSVICLN